jgi:hypothetical protein
VHWDTAARAVQNQVRLIGVHSTGVSNGAEVGGHTLVADARGEVMGAITEPWVLTMDLDRSGRPRCARNSQCLGGSPLFPDSVRKKPRGGRLQPMQGVGTPRYSQ